MRVANATLFPQASQSSSQPCSHNTILVSLKADFSIYTRCTPSITIIGFTGTTTLGAAATWTDKRWPSYSLNLTDGTNGMFETQAAWNMTSGELVVQLQTDLTGLTSYNFSFTVQNGPVSQPAVSLELTTVSIFEPAAVALATGKGADDAPLFIRSLNFTTKRIAQSDAHPCAPNAITVTLQTSVNLLATCLSESNDAFARYPRITISGLTGTRVGPSAFVSSSPAFDEVNPFFDATAGTLVFTPLADVLSTEEYTFNFTVRNQPTAQSAPSIRVSADIMPAGPSAMDSPSDALYQAMSVIQPAILVEGTFVNQSTDQPCAVNTITIAIATNVPIYTFCNPSLTFTGLTSNTVTKPVLSSATQSGFTIRTWTASSGNLTIAFKSGQDTTMTLAFDLTNPSMRQNAPGMSLTLTYDDPTSANLATWSNAATINGTRFLASDVGAFDATHASYPMRVRTAELNSSISQSSPYACDENKIRVAFVPTVDLLLACFPSLSITGLTGSATLASTISVNISIAGTTEAWSNNASWSRTPGELVVEILGAAAESSIVTAGQSVVVSFTLHNPNSGQAAPAIATLGVTLRLEDSTHARDDHATSPITYPGNDLSSLDFDGKSSCTKQAGDADPLFVRPVKFTSGSIAQSSATPCDSNVITVGITTDGPLFTDCVSAVTLAGLAGSSTATTSQFFVDARPSYVSSTASWYMAGTLTLSTIATWQGCEAVTVSFNLTNPRTPQASQNASVSFTATVAGLSDVDEHLELVKAAGNLPSLTSCIP